MDVLMNQTRASELNQDDEKMLIKSNDLHLGTLNQNSAGAVPPAEHHQSFSAVDFPTNSKYEL